MLKVVRSTYPKFTYFPINKFWKVYLDTNPIFSTNPILVKYIYHLYYDDYITHCKIPQLKTTCCLRYVRMNE